MRRTLIFLAVLVGYQGLLHRALERPTGWLAITLLLIPIAGFGLWFVATSKRPLTAALLATLAGVGMFMLWRAAPASLYGATHVLGHLLLFWWFARTLKPGAKAFITEIAEAVNGTLPDYMVRYSRQVTWAWSLFFAAMALTSALLFALAPLSVWSFFANVLNWPLVLLMFLGEYTYRVRRFPDYAHASLLTNVKAVTKYLSSFKATQPR